MHGFDRLPHRPEVVGSKAFFDGPPVSALSGRRRSWDPRTAYAVAMLRPGNFPTRTPLPGRARVRVSRDRPRALSGRRQGPHRCPATRCLC
jgi:hypothetical protein